MTYDPSLHLQRRADEMAREAAANAPDRWFCATCQRHRVRGPGQDCPVCEEAS